MCYFGEATLVNFSFSPDRSTHVGWSLQKYLEFSLKNLEKNGNFTPKTLGKLGILFGGKSKNPGPDPLAQARGPCVFAPDPPVQGRGPCVFALNQAPDPPAQARGPCMCALIHQLRPEGLVCLPWSTSPDQRALCLPWSTSPGQRALCVCPDPPPQARGPCVFALIHLLRPEDLVSDPPGWARGPCVFALIHQPRTECLMCLPGSTTPGQRALCVCLDPPAQARGPCVSDPPGWVRGPCVFALIYQPRTEGLVCLPWSTSPGQRALCVCPDPPAQARALCVFALIHQAGWEDLVCVSHIHHPRTEGFVCLPWSTSPGQRALCICPDLPGWV